jgi:hypothetical protein
MYNIELTAFDTGIILAVLAGRAFEVVMPFFSGYLPGTAYAEML